MPANPYSLPGKMLFRAVALAMFETEPKHTRENTMLVVVVLVTLALLLVVGYFYFVG